ncbi:MAG: DUF885 family protein [Woeseiaceae bacterium]|nr:DUF885 family protein [Woeseiaceae bacterium]
MPKPIFELTITCLLGLALVSCSPETTEAPAETTDSAEAAVMATADTYIEAWFEHFPEMATFYRIEGKSHDRLTDNTPEGRAAWQAVEDQLLADLASVDPDLLEGSDAWLPYGILLESLEASRDSRVCETHGWNIDQVWGWQIWLGELATAQPASTDEETAWALARWQRIPAYIDNEIDNLRDGLGAGYSAPQRNVSLVVEQIDSLLGMNSSESPLYAPAVTAEDDAFSEALAQLIEDDIYPAMQRYRDFLVDEYHDRARTEIAVAALPNGAACYVAQLRTYTTLPYEPEEMFEAGKEAVALREEQITVVGERVFETGDLAEIRTRMNDDESNRFESREEVLEYTTAAVNRAREATPLWFGKVPEADVVIKPVPEYQEQSSTSRYVPASDDGALPGTYFINLFQPEEQTRGSVESLSFHEAYPGHHLQIALAQERSAAHPVTRYIGNSGFIEGWARYTETLANEMGLYSSDRNTLEMLSGLPTGMVVDPGIHAMGWSRDEAIEYTLSKQTHWTPEAAATYVDRIVVWPGQMTTYGAGELEFIRLRRQAEATLGDDFDIREFHDQALGNGSVTLIMLRSQINDWLNRYEPGD